MDLLFLNGFGPSALTLRAHCVRLSSRFALLGLNELPITWFEGTDAKSGSFINQQLRWPALNLSAVKHRREPRIAGETLRFRYAAFSGKRGRRVGIDPGNCLPGGE